MSDDKTSATPIFHIVEQTTHSVSDENRSATLYEYFVAWDGGRLPRAFAFADDAYFIAGLLMCDSRSFVKVREAAIELELETTAATKNQS